MPRDKLKLTPTADGYVLDEQVGFLMRVAMQRHTSIFTAQMVEGLTQTQFAALAKLHDAGRVSQIELGRLTAMDPATIWGVINRLAKQGYVGQSPAPNDGRLVMVELTDAGRKATLRMKAVAAEVSRETLRPFTSEEAKQLLALLGRLGD